MRSRPFLVLVLLALVEAPAATTLAAPPRADVEEKQTAARSRGEDGLRLFEAGRWSEAYDAFEEADGLYHAPTLVLFMARCQRNQGKLQKARELYERVIAEPVPKGAPEQFSKAVAMGRSELEDLRKRIPSVQVEVRGASAEKARVEIDGAPLSEAERASGKPLDPGDHEIVAAAADGASARKTLSLKEGEVVRVELTLELPPEEPPPAPPPPSPPAPLPAPPAPRASPAPEAPRVPRASPSPRASLVPAAIALSVGGVGVGVGAISGILAMTKIADIKSRCHPNGHCLKSDQPKAAEARTLVTTSIIGFAAGGVGLAAGATLLILRPSASKTSAHLELGLGSVAIGGKF